MMHFSVFLDKLLRISPEDLGHPDDALPSREFGARPGEYTWDDWRDEVRAKYPVRYFVAQTIGGELDVLAGRADRAWYWLKCHVHPKYRAYSKIDLRNPGPGIDYKYGWIDRADALFYAAFVCLRDFVEKENPQDPAQGWSLEEIEEDEQLKFQKERYDEIMALYNWWMHGRLEEEAKEEELYQAFTKVRHMLQEAEEFRAAGDAWTAYRRWRAEREDEMLLRLCKVRGSLWT